MATHKFPIGTVVRHTSAFLRSIGSYAGNHVNGVVVAIAKGLNFPVVLWSGGGEPKPVNPVNLEVHKAGEAQMTPGVRASVVATGAAKYQKALDRQAAEDAAYHASPEYAAFKEKRGILRSSLSNPRKGFTGAKKKGRRNPTLLWVREGAAWVAPVNGGRFVVQPSYITRGPKAKTHAFSIMWFGPGKVDMLNEIHIGYAATAEAAMAKAGKARIGSARVNPAPAASPAIQRKLASLRYVEQDAFEAWKAHNTDLVAERKYRAQFNRAKNLRELLEEQIARGLESHRAWGETFHRSSPHFVASGVYEPSEELARRKVQAQKVRKKAGDVVARIVSTRKSKGNPRKNPATVSLPARVGEAVSINGSEGTLRVTKTKRDSYHAALVGSRTQTWGPSGARWGNAKEMREDIAHWLRTGALPYSGGSVR